MQTLRSKQNRQDRRTETVYSLLVHADNGLKSEFSVRQQDVG